MTSASMAARPPAISIKPSPMSASPPPTSASSPSTLMSKEWVVPPRPKPGRKPALDTPATKRKAQNRAAQRAFRERRAARVGELEEQMKEMDDEHEQELDTLRLNVERLEKEVDYYRSELNKWREKARNLQRNADPESGNVPLPPRYDTRHNVGTNPASIQGCGRCSPNSTCQCLDHALNAMGASSSYPPEISDKRPLSPSTVQSHKRLKAEPDESLEVDFTHVYSSKTNSSVPRHGVVSEESTAPDLCGFCQDGTPCICAEMAAAERETQKNAAISSTNAAESSITERLAPEGPFTPPASEGELNATQVATSGPCAGGPGTCAQCRADPQSTLFCKTLAASRSQSQQPSSSCCGGADSNGVCCQQQQPLSQSTRSTRSKANKNITPVAQHLTRDTDLDPKTSSITLTCADAYAALSRHPAFERASNEVTSWMPKLHASSVQDSTSAGQKGATKGDAAVFNHGAGRPAMEIDAANVMAVLKDFDRRFGER